MADQPAFFAPPCDRTVTGAARSTWVPDLTAAPGLGRSVTMGVPVAPLGALALARLFAAGGIVATKRRDKWRETR